MKGYLQKTEGCWFVIYDQSDLTKLVLENEFEEVTFIKNIF